MDGIRTQGGPPPGRRGSRAGEGGGSAKKMLGGLLKRTLMDPAEANTPVIPGTNFTEGGVRKLMSALAQRSGGDQKLGGAARRAYDFITRPGDERFMFAGANITQLKKLLKFVGELGTADHSFARGPRHGVGREGGSRIVEGQTDRLAALEGSVTKLAGLVEELSGKLANAPVRLEEHSSGRAPAGRASGTGPKARPAMDATARTEKVTLPNVPDESNAWVLDYIAKD